MSVSTPVPLLCFRILAQRSGKPAGLLLDVGAVGAMGGMDGDNADQPSLVALMEADEMRELASQFACFHRPGLAPALAAPLHAAGWKVAVSLLRVDERLARDSLPASVAWIEGDWCMAPPAKASGAQAASRVNALQMVQLVAADADTHEIEALLRRDPTLSYNLLRLVNSLGVGTGRRITSFSQALLLLGRQQLRRWLNLMLFAARQDDPRSAMLLARVALRARAIELLARSRGLDKNTQEQGFMTGMFSLLGVLFGMPLGELLAPLALGEAVHAALLRREGELGALLVLFETAERGDPGAVAAQLAALQIPHEDFNLAMVDAALWMQGTLRESLGAVDA
jgi:EAL and modified HD-GYP domain-containing signal transduction protein